MDDNEVLSRPHPCHGCLGRIFMLSNYIASGTAPSGQDPSAKSTHRATAPHGKEQARGEGHYVTASKSKLISMQPQYAVHPGTGPFRRAAISHAYRNPASRAESKILLMQAYVVILAYNQHPKAGSSPGLAERTAFPIRKVLMR